MGGDCKLGCDASVVIAIVVATVKNLIYILYIELVILVILVNNVFCQQKYTINSTKHYFNFIRLHGK